MSGSTAGGIPYVTPDDHPKEYPTASQQLAELLSAKFAALPRIAAGEFQVHASGTTPLTFPVGLFTDRPKVVALPVNTIGIQLAVRDVSVNGCAIVAGTTGGVPTPGEYVYWIAAQT